MKPKVVTIASIKGGVGKTTTAAALASALAERGNRVALIDADPQGSVTKVFRMELVKTPWKSEPVGMKVPGLHKGSITLVRSGKPLRRANEEQLTQHLEREDLEADIVVIDTAPGEIEIADAAISIADVVVVPYDTSPTAMDGLLDVIEIAGEYDDPPVNIRVLLTRVDRRRKIFQEMVDRVSQVLGGNPKAATYRLLETVIPENSKVAEAPDYGVPVTLYDRGSAASQAYETLADEILPLLRTDSAPTPALAAAGGA